MTRIAAVLANHPAFLADDPAVLANYPAFLADAPAVLANDPAFLAEESGSVLGEGRFLFDETRAAALGRRASQAGQPIPIEGKWVSSNRTRVR